MLKEYKTVGRSGAGEYEEKKSRFLGEAIHIESLQEAEEAIAAIRKKHYDARHHCFAFLAGEPGTPEEIVRSSDDGEPSGTAGKPILEILKGRDLHNTLIVVTRYFGGTLLGTGGLMRSYVNAAAAAADDAELKTMVHGIRMSITCTYPAYGKFQYLFAREGISLGQASYQEDVTFEVLVPEKEEERVRKLVTETTDGRGTCTVKENLLYQKS